MMFACVLAVFALFSCGQKKAEAKKRGILFQGEIAELTAESDGVTTFSFSENQKNALAAINKKYMTLSLSVTLKSTADTTFFLISGGEKKNAATAPESVFDGKAVTLSLCASALPEGFAIQCASPVEILHVDAEETKIGWTESDDAKFFGFGLQGGIANASKNFTDFSGGRLYFGANAGTYASILYKPQSKAQALNVAVGSEKLAVRRRARQTATVIPSLALRDVFAGISIENTSDIAGVLLRYNPEMKNPLKALKADPGLVPDWDLTRWRNADFEVFDWEEFPGVLIFDMKNYAVQDLFLKRLSFFAEKTGFRGSLAPDAKIANLHGFNAHDYRADTLAAFFNKADAEHFPLNQNELLLKRILIANGVLVQAADGVKAGQGALVSISRESPEYLRWQFLNHECFHGIFFTHEEFRAKMESIYNSMDRKSLEFIKMYYRVSPELDYDTADLYLMHNELMAYTVQSRLSNVRQYYKNLAGRAHVQKAIPELANYVLSTNAEGFYDIARQIDDFVSENYALNAGRVYQITRE